jgi:hypothetical protein
MEHLLVFEDVLLRKQDPALRGFHGALTKGWNRLSGRRAACSPATTKHHWATRAGRRTRVRYVLWNAYHHRARGSAPDRASSARWSGAWATAMTPSRARLAQVFAAQTYVLREAKRRFPLQRCRPPRGMRVDGVG